ncbi:MAG: YdcF family protein [Muribaculaceae bacterium]|nr:YdcF family protein [Muribaculaceae bacterium]
MKRKYLKITAICISIVLAIGLITLGVMYSIVSGNANGRIYDDIADIPHNRVGLLLATSPVTPAGIHNYYFDARIQSADELYKAGKIDYIIASGGNYVGLHPNGCDEPQAIKDSLVNRGIPAERIILDYDGTRTIHSILKAHDVYNLDSLTLISQKFHNERAIYQADHFGLHTIGYNATTPPIPQVRTKNIIREIFARPRMFLDLLTDSHPQFRDTINSIPPVNPITPTSGDFVDIRSTVNLNIYKPNYSKIDLTCINRPSKQNDSIIMMIGAAYTGKCLKEFDHTNIMGSHASKGEFFENPIGSRATGTFTYSDGTPAFHYKGDQNAILQTAAARGGCGFVQDMLIHEGKIVPHTRPGSSTCHFRALCLLDGDIVVVDSKENVNFDFFLKCLTSLGVTEAIYTDMGDGWNYSWYLENDGSVREIHPTPGEYSSNWLVFYK